MKHVAIVLAAGVVAGLLVYFVLEWTSEITLTPSGWAAMQPIIFVATLAGVGFVSAALALLFRVAFARSENRAIRDLSDRVAQLESLGGRTAPARAAAPPAPAAAPGLDGGEG